MTVTVCDICGEIIEQNVKEPAKGACFCGKCLGILAAMVMERNKQADSEESISLEKLEKDMRNAPIVPCVMGPPTVTISGNAEYAEEYVNSVLYGRADIQSFFDECSYVGSVLDELKNRSKYESAECFLNGEPQSDRVKWYYAVIKECVNRLGITKYDIEDDRQKPEKSNSQDSEEDKGIENPISQDPEPNEEPPPAAPPKHERKKRVNIDHGRVIALHNAGWPNWRIADELGASSDAITHLLSRARKAGENVMTAEEIAADKKKRNRIV